MSTEIERKFLIERPVEAELQAQTDCRLLRITQTYLVKVDPQTERRVRRIEENGHITYRYTEKGPLIGIGREEREREIGESEYRAALEDAVSELEKTRHTFPYRDHLIEIDIYPDTIADGKLRGLAVLEIELGSEDEAYEIPPFIQVRKELTGTREFSNKSLATPCVKLTSRPDCRTRSE